MVKRLTEESQNYPEHLEILHKNLYEVNLLIDDIQTYVATYQFGHIEESKVIHKSALVLLIACWESYIKDLATNSFYKILELSNSPAVFPNEFLSFVLKKLKDTDRAKLWNSTGNGWKTIFNKNRNTILKEYLKNNFHGPGPKSIKNLFKKLIGETQLLDHWKLKGMQKKTVKKYLNELITTRNEIAHKMTSQALNKEYINKAISSICFLADISSNRLCEFICMQTDSAPDDVWIEVPLY